MKNNERKNQLIKAASKRFSKLGYYKTTLDEIARDIRIGKATIYHYFKSKDELYNSVLDWELNDILERIKSIFNDETSEILDKFVKYFELKNNVLADNKVISLLFIRDISSELNESESKILEKLLNDESNILTIVTSSLNSKDSEKYDTKTTTELVYLSLMISVINNKLIKDDKEKSLFNDLRIKSIIKSFLT